MKDYSTNVSFDGIILFSSFSLKLVVAVSICLDYGLVIGQTETKGIGRETMEQMRRHYFPINDETLVTSLCANGDFCAHREDDRITRGYGHNRYAAIADLVEAIEKAKHLEDA